jgi:hypothetical protein
MIINQRKVLGYCIRVNWIAKDYLAQRDAVARIRFNSIKLKEEVNLFRC